MSQQTNLAAAFLRLVNAVNAVSGRVGTLGNLTTTDKTSLVNALNEVKAAASSGAGINDSATATTSTWSSTKVQAQINAAITALINGAGSDADTLKELADKITALAQADAGLLSVNQAQAFNAAQQLQGCQNLGLGDPTWNYVTAIEAALAAGL